MTASSGPGIALKSEAMNLAVMVELPLIVIDVQRAGPSTGMPTKTEQADLLQVMFGRNSDSPVAIVAPATPAECFDYAIEAVRLALKYMTPVVYLSDAFLATGAEPWQIPSVDGLPEIAVPNHTERSTFQPYARDPGDARPSVGRPRHAGSRAPDRWAREGRRHRQRQLRPGEPSPHADAPPGEDRADRERHPGPGGARAPGGRAARARVGIDVRRDPVGGGAAPGRGTERRPRPPSIPQSLPRQHGRGPRPVPQGAHPRGQPRPAPAADPGPLPGPGRGLQQGPRQAVPDLGDPREGRTDAGGPIQHQ